MWGTGGFFIFSRFEYFNSVIQVFAVSEGKEFEIMECSSQGISFSSQIVQLCISAVLECNWNMCYDAM